MEELDVNSAIAGEIMTPYVIMLENDAVFSDATETMSKNQISAVFIHDNTKNEYYIITKTDIVDFLNRGGFDKEGLAKVPVTELMQGPIEMLDIEMPVDKIIRYMTKHNYKRVLISKESKATGVVSTRDIMKWNNTYFKPAKPQILLFMDNMSSNFIARHIFEEHIEYDLKRDLIDLYGGALNTISLMHDEIIDGSGKMSHLIKEKNCILFEPYRNITGMLICDYNNIELRRKLKMATKRFYEKHTSIFQKADQHDLVLHDIFDIDYLISIFRET